MKARWRSTRYLLCYQILIHRLRLVIGHPDSSPGNWRVCLDSVRSHRVHQAVLHGTESAGWNRRTRGHKPEQWSIGCCWCRSWASEWCCLRASGTYSYPCVHSCHILCRLICATGLQTQSAKNPAYAGPLDAIKKIFSAHGVAGIFKGQGVTFTREAMGYGAYFLAYEKLVQRQMALEGIRRDQIHPARAVLYGAAAGYAVSPSRSPCHPSLIPSPCLSVMGCHIPYRHDQVANADRWFLARYRSEVYLCHRLCTQGVADRGNQGFHSRPYPNIDPVRSHDDLQAPNYSLVSDMQISLRQRCYLPWIRNGQPCTELIRIIMLPRLTHRSIDHLCLRTLHEYSFYLCG